MGGDCGGGGAEVEMLPFLITPQVKSSSADCIQKNV